MYISLRLCLGNKFVLHNGFQMTFIELSFEFLNLWNSTKSKHVICIYYRIQNSKCIPSSQVGHRVKLIDSSTMSIIQISSLKIDQMKIMNLLML